MKNKPLTTQDTARVAISTVFMIVCSWISIPAPIPFSMQNFGAVIICLLLSRKQALFTIITYILLGMAGLPVFAGFRTGATVLSGPTGGYIVGFLCLPLIIGRNSVTTSRNKASTFLYTFIGTLIIYALGTLWYALIFLDKCEGILPILSLCVFPYIIPDLAKIILAVTCAEKLKRKIRG